MRKFVKILIFFLAVIFIIFAIAFFTSPEPQEGESRLEVTTRNIFPFTGPTTPEPETIRPEEERETEDEISEPQTQTEESKLKKISDQQILSHKTTKVEKLIQWSEEEIKEEERLLEELDEMTENLEPESTGEKVVELQTFLENTGFLQIPDGVNKGYFGNLTIEALEEYTESIRLEEEFEEVLVALYALRDEDKIKEAKIETQEKETIMEDEDFTIPRPENILFLNNGVIIKDADLFFYQSFDGQTSGALPEEILEIDYFKEREEFLATIDLGDEIVFVLSSPEGGDQRPVFRSAFSEWEIDWFSEDKALIKTKPSNQTSGFAYILNLNNGQLQRLLGDKKGLTVNISPDGQKAVYSFINDDELKTGIYNIENKTEQILNIETLSEKCVWQNEDEIICAVPNHISTANNFPDDWYKGNISFSDFIYSIDTTSGEDNLIFTPKPEEGLERLDAINLDFYQEENLLIFKNKINNLLWSLEID